MSTPRIAVLVLALLLLPAAAPAAHAKGGKAEVLQKIEALMDGGDYDQARQMIDYFLGKNPGDPDLLVLLDRWRVRQGDLAGVLEMPEGREATRAACWRVVAATMKGNPDEWAPLLDAGDPARATDLLAGAKATGTPEDRRVAGELLERLAAPAAEGPTDVPPERVLAAIRSDDPDQVLWGLRLAEERKLASAKADARRIWEKSDAPDEKYAAAAVLLALGEEKVGDALRETLRADRPVDAVEAGKALFRHPGADPKAAQKLLDAIGSDERIGRAKPTLVSLGLAAVAGRNEPGAREYIEARLSEPDARVDAARALGALGDDAAVPALLEYLRSPPPAREGATSGGLGFLGGRSGGASDAAAAETLRPALVGALAILRLTAASASK